MFVAAVLRLPYVRAMGRTAPLLIFQENEITIRDKTLGTTIFPLRPFRNL